MAYLVEYIQRACSAYLVEHTALGEATFETAVEGAAHAHTLTIHDEKKGHDTTSGDERIIQDHVKEGVLGVSLPESS